MNNEMMELLEEFEKQTWELDAGEVVYFDIRENAWLPVITSKAAA